MLKFLPILLIAAYAVVMWKMSASALRRKLDRESRPLDQPELEAVSRRLGRAAEVPELRAFVLPEPAFNGLAAPDGRIFITDGVLQAFRRGEVSADEIGSIIAHELGHVAMGHSKRRMVEMAAQNSARMVLMMVIGRFIPFIGPWIANILVNLVTAGLSRRDEYEADAYAAALMRRAGVAPKAQWTLFEKLADKHGDIPAGAAWLMGHPPMPKRIAAVRRLQAQWDATGQ
ncbi:M48 family metalloprotease [Rhodovulum sp. DZ06]|uniref:M48 family metalloprotease n=1 Tax=Rhodovulum sp. DZ06 TaxID=3425126 RepID=UPI003D351882